MNIRELINHLNLGQEIGFLYNGNSYFITYTGNGWLLYECNNPENEHEFKTISELIKLAKIDGNNIADIWDNVTIDVVF